MDPEQTRSSLLRRIRDPDDRVGWGQFYEFYQPLLVRYVRSRGINENDAEDLVQDIFVNKLRKAMEEFELDRGRGRFRTWLFQVTINAIRDWSRQKQNQVAGTGNTSQFTGPIVPSVTEELSREWEKYHHEQVMQFAMKKVRQSSDAKTWACFEERTLRGKSGQSVAAQLGLTVSAVYTNAHRVLEKIRQMCEEHDEELSPLDRT